MALTIHLNQFDGPLDMLLFLIGKAKIDIRDIFVSEVTDQYIQSVREAEDLDMEDASAFITMAATLIEIKSRSLLPKPQTETDEEDPEKLLIRQLEEYQRYKQSSQELKALEKAAEAVFSKLPEEYPLPPPSLELKGLTLDGLFKAFSEVLRRLEEKGEEGNAFVPRRIVRDAHDIPGCMKHIRGMLKRGPTRFFALFSEEPSREEVITLFLALLELIRLGQVTVVQKDIYTDIELQRGTGRPVDAQETETDTDGPEADL